MRFCIHDGTVFDSAKECSMCISVGHRCRWKDRGLPVTDHYGSSADPPDSRSPRQLTRD